MILINGEYKEYIHASDRGLHYGDGLFETIEISNGKSVFLQEHLARLSAGCNRLKIPCPDADLLVVEIERLCAGIESAVLKIVITRGSGGRGYRPAEISFPLRILSLHPSPDYPPHFQKLGIRARFCDTRLGLNPGLAGIKHLNRLEQVMARSEWRSPAIKEGILSDTDNHIIEGTMSNVFYAKSNVLHTPALTHCGVKGIVRGVVRKLCLENGVSVIERNCSKLDLLSADEAFVCNSIIGIWPINRLADRQFPVGELTRQIQHWYGLAKAKDLSREV